MVEASVIEKRTRGCKHAKSRLVKPRSVEPIPVEPKTHAELATEPEGASGFGPKSGAKSEAKSRSKELRRMSRSELIEIIHLLQSSETESACSSDFDSLSDSGFDSNSNSNSNSATNSASVVSAPATSENALGGGSFSDARPIETPSAEDVTRERARLRHRKAYRHTLCTTAATLVVVAAIAALLATLLLPVMQVSGSSMEPALADGDVVVAVSAGAPSQGDLVGFYYQNKLLVKRVIACPGDTVDIDAEGNVSVNGEVLDEPYVTEKSLGECDIELPLQVPENRWFVLGDNRSSSIDSRNAAIGCIEKDQIVGTLAARIWPLDRISAL